MKIGIVGLGVVGGSLYRWVSSNTTHELFRDDPLLGLDEIKDKMDCIFLCIPVPTAPNGTQDVSILKGCVKKYLKYEHTVFYVRSTVIPKTCDHLMKFYKRRIYAMPEFLTERIAEPDFNIHGILCGTDIENREASEEQEKRLNEIFRGKRITLVSNREAELAKYAHNCSAAIKISFFNLIARYSEVIGADYTRVLDGALMSGHINETHTQVPGPDGKTGFGGKCFPKDLLAFVKELKRMGLQSGLSEMAFYENVVNRLQWGKWLKQPEIKYPDEYKTQNLESLKNF